jgi:phospholipase C
MAANTGAGPQASISQPYTQRLKHMTNGDGALNRIDHIVVLMMENRSFDNVLGWLYDPNNKPPFNKVPNGQTFEGVSGKNLTNPRSDGSQVPVGQGTSMIDPYPDPNEPYTSVYAQMYNDHSNPNPVPNPTTSPSMKGFVIDYAAAIAAAGVQPHGCSRILSALFRGRSPMAFDPGIIMNCFTPASLPVINGLANAFGVCDHWFCSVPTQTLPNRSFLHAATSSGYVVNGWKTGPHEWDIAYLLNKTETIFNLLSQAGVDWRIYHGGPFLLCNALVTQDRLWEYVPSGRHFFPFKQFLDDASRGDLPAYTFIEPNMLCSRQYGAENDMHPAFAITETGAATNVLYGDELFLQIYEALIKGPRWNSTLFIITFDEHGGTYDHVPTPPPPAAVPDHLTIPPGAPGYSGFDFKRYGVRVPAVVVSPWIQQGTVFNTVFDHTSVIKTISNRWLNGKNLTQRDLNARDLSEVLNSPKAREDRPTFTPNPPPTFKGCGDHPLSWLHKVMVKAAADHVQRFTKERMNLEQVKTTDDAVRLLDDRELTVKAAVTQQLG